MCCLMVYNVVVMNEQTKRNVLINELVLLQMGGVGGITVKGV